MQIYLLFLILLSLCTTGIYIVISTKKIIELLESVETPSKATSTNEINRKYKAKEKNLKNYDYEELFKDEEVFFVQEIQFDLGESDIELDIKKPED